MLKISIATFEKFVFYSMAFSRTFKMSFKAFGILPKTFNFFSQTPKCRFYKSLVSLDNLYPESVNIKPFEPPKSTDGKFTGYIPINALKITSVCSSGPGGQNVNKVETKIDIRFHVQSATWLSEATKQKLIDKYYTRINKEGYFIIRSEKTRSKILNQAEAITYLRELIFKLEKPEPEVSAETLEKIRKNKEKAARLRLMEKRTRALKNRLKYED